MKTQYIGDDVLYQFYYPDVPVQGVPHGVDKDHPISNICDVVLSQINHYKNINGRMIVHVLVQTFCGLCPKWIFDIVNSVFFVFFLFILKRICNIGKEVPLSSVSLIPFALCYIFMVHPHVYYAGPAGGINYLWSSVFCLAFVYIVISNYTNKSNLIWTYVISFIAGWSMEAIVIPVGLVLFLFGISNMKKLTKYQIGSMLVFFAGAILLVFAPGNFVRKSHSEGISLHSIIEFCKCIRLIYPLSLLVAYSYFFKKKDLIIWFSNTFNKSLLIGLYVICLVMCLVIGPAAPRVGYGLELISAVLITSLLMHIAARKLVFIMSYVCGISVIVVFGFTLYYQNKASNQIEDITQQIEQSQGSNCAIIVEEHIPGIAKHYITCYDVYYAPNWATSVWEWYYDKKIEYVNR